MIIGFNGFWTGLTWKHSGWKTPLAAAYFSVQEVPEPILFSNDPVLLVGTTTKWLFTSENYVLSHGGVPVFVNACMPEMTSMASGVCFSLEQAVYDCLEYLKQLKKEKPVLIGLNPSSDADHRKAEVF